MLTRWTVGNPDPLSPADTERVRRWNQPVVHATGHPSCIHTLVQAMVDSQPHAQAVSSWDGEMTYAALSQAACQLAHHLVSLGVGPEVTVGVCMDKSLWAMVSMLAILQSGGVVVALGTHYPLSRIGAVVVDAGIRVLLLDKAQSSRLEGTAGVTHQIVVEGSLFERLPVQTVLPRTSVSPDSAAWIIYTSGSTGTPKGVVLEHKALCTGIIAHGRLFGNGPHTRALQFASHTFGVVIEDMFTTLVFGGCACIPSEDERLDMDGLARMMRGRHVNFINVTTTAASLIDPRAVPGVETVVLGGEAVTAAVVARWTGHAGKILNAYGQSECAVESVVGEAIAHGREAARIGLPIGGCAAWVVDPADYHRLVPVGAPGELLIQGPLLARGYLNDAAKTAACFVEKPEFLAGLGPPLAKCRGRMYRTGDLVQQKREDGSLTYLGRCDDQIKVRGQRMEPGEVESRIVQLHPEVRHAFVDVVTPCDASPPADAVLVAAIELHGGGSGTCSGPPTVGQPTAVLTALAQRIRAALLHELPPYMVPNHVVCMSSHLPINASGKRDRRATRAILAGLSRGQLGALGRATRDEDKDADRTLSATEEKLRDVFSEVLGRPAGDIGPDDHFVQLGGDSVAAMRVVAACRRRGMGLSVRDVLQRRNLSALSLCVEAEGHTGNEVGECSAVTDHQAQILNYHVAHPDVDTSYFGLDASTAADIERIADTCRALVASVEALHTGFARQDGGGWKRIVVSSFRPEIGTHVTDATLDHWTEDFIGRKGFPPVEPACGQPLVDIAICTRKPTGEHRILVRLSHAIYDGISLPTLWSALGQLYHSGRATKTAPFSQYVAQIERRQTEEAAQYWTSLLRDAAMTAIRPVASQGSTDYLWSTRAMGPKTMDLGQNVPQGATCANVIKAAWALVLAQHAERDDVVFSDVVSGRSGVDGSAADAVGCCATVLPVRVRLDASWTYRDLVYALQDQQLESMPFETFGFGPIARHCTDWPLGTAPTSLVSHAPTRIAGAEFNMGGATYTVRQPKQIEPNYNYSEIRIAWQQVDKSLEFDLVYANEYVPEELAQRLYDGLVSTLERILTSPQALINEQLP